MRLVLTPQGQSRARCAPRTRADLEHLKAFAASGRASRPTSSRAPRSPTPRSCWSRRTASGPAGGSADRTRRSRSPRSTPCRCTTRRWSATRSGCATGPPAQGRRGFGRSGVIARFSRYLSGRDAEDELPPVALAPDSPVESLEAALGVIPPRQQLPLPRWLGSARRSAAWPASCRGSCTSRLTLPRAHAPTTTTSPGSASTARCGSCWPRWRLGALRRHPATGPVAAVAATMLRGRRVVRRGDELERRRVRPRARPRRWARRSRWRSSAPGRRSTPSGSGLAPTVACTLRWEWAIGLVRQLAAERAIAIEDPAAAVSPPPPAPPRR